MNSYKFTLGTEADNFHNFLNTKEETEQDSFATRFNALNNAFDEKTRDNLITNYNGAIKYNLPNPLSFEKTKQFIEQNRNNVTREQEEKVKKYAPDTATLCAMADSMNSIVAQKYFKDMAQYERTVRALSEPNAPKDIKDIFSSKVKPIEDTGYNTAESIVYGAGTGINNAKRGMQTLGQEARRWHIERNMPDEMKNEDWMKITESKIQEYAEKYYPHNIQNQELFFTHWNKQRQLYQKIATDLFDNANEWALKAQETGGFNEFIFDVSSGVAQVIPLVAASVATQGAALPAMVASFGMTYGQSLDQYRQDPLVNQNNTRNAALINASLSSILDGIGAKGIAKSILNKSSKNALGHTLINWGLGAFKEGATEYLQSYPEFFAKQFAYGKFDNADMEAFSNLLRDFASADFQKDALYQGLVGSFAGGSLGAIGLRGEYKQKAIQIKNLIQAQKLAKEQPEIFQNFVHKLQKEGVTIPDIFVSAKVVDGLKQERNPELTDFDKQPLESFLEEVGISMNEYELALASGSPLQIAGDSVHKALQTELGMKLFQENNFSISSNFETDGIDSFLGSLYQEQRQDRENLQGILEQAEQKENGEIGPEFDEYASYTLKNEAELSPEEFAYQQKIQADLDIEEKAYNEENYLTQQIMHDIEEKTRLTDTPYTETQSKTLSSLFMAEIKTFAHNYNIPLQEAFKQRRPLFLGSVASTSDYQNLVAKAYEEIGVSNFDAKALDKALYQLNDGVDLESEVPVVAIEPRFQGREVWEFTKNKEVAKLKKELTGVYHNKATGWDIHLTGHGVEHSISSATRRGVGGKAHIEAVANLPKLIENAVLVESHPDRKGQGLSAIHRMYVPMHIDNSIFTVKLTVKESNQGMEAVIEDMRRLYDLSLEKEILDGATVSPHTPLITARSGHSTPSISKMTLRSLLEDVKDSEGKNFFQLSHDTASYQHNKIIQGSINQVEGAKSIIRFFTATDISTGFHEFGHYMRFGLEQKALLENAREQDKQDWQTACDYVGAKFGETWTREQEEKFADSVLLYLQTGEAPSKGLKRVFANIARWLTKLYTKVTQTNIAITPEIKDVFDRQLATEKEILAARQKIGIAEMNPLLTNLQETDLSYLSAEERERFNTLVQEADAETYTAMIAKKGKELSEKKQAWAKNARLAYELEPDITEIRQVIYEGGIYFDEQMQNQYKESLQALYENNPELYAKLFTTDKSKAVDLDKIAERFNKEGAGAIASLMGHIARIPHEQAFIEQYIQEQEQAWRESWDNTELLLNDNVEEALGILANALAKKIGHTSFDTKQLHSIVVDKVKENKIGEVENLIEKYEVTAKENALLEKASARKIQKLEAKIIAQRLELLEKKRVAIAVLREKYKAKELKNKGVQYVKRVAKTKPEKIDFAYSEQIKALGNKFGITGKLLAPRDKENLPSLAQFVADNQLDSSIFPEWLLASPQDENIRYKDLSVEEFKDLMNVFTLLEHKGKDIKQVELLGKKQSLEERVKELNASASQLEDKKSITDWERNYNKSKKVRSILRSLGADLTNYVYTFLAADGYRKDVDQVNGVFYQTFLAPLYEAQKTSYRLSCVMNEKIQTVLDPIINMKKEKRQERWSLPDVPLSYEVARVFGENNSWDYEKMIMVALNMGNADNMKKLMNGFGWERKHLDLITQRMTKEDWQMVQNIWDTINELYPELDAVYKKVNGIPMKKVEANKLETPYGVLEGGYFPLVFDSRLASIDQNAKLELEKLQQNSFSINIAKTVDGFTKTRKGNANIPLKLSFDIIDKHIQDSIQYISYEPSIHNIRKVIHNNDFASMYKDKFSVDVYNGLEAWLANIAKPQRDTITTTERLLEKTRELGTLYALGYNIKTALMSFTGLAPIVHEVGLINTIKGAGYLLKNREKAYQQIQKISTLMADRPKNINQDIAQNMAKFNPTNAPTLQINAFGNDYNIYWKDIQKFAFSMVTATDAMVSYTGWIAAYNKAMQETNGDIEKARAYADLVVERSQSSGTAMHLTALQRGHGIKKIITMFMTYSLNYWNNLQYQTRGLKEGKVSALEYASWILWYHTMPAILTVMINGLWKEGEIPNPFGDDDDEDKYKGAKEYGQEIFINGLIQGLPVVRNIPSLFEYNQSNMTGSSVMDNGLVSTARSFYNGGLLFYSLFDDSLESEEIWGKFIKHSIDSSSYWTGIPAHKVLQLYEKANKVLDWYQN